MGWNFLYATSGLSDTTFACSHEQAVPIDYFAGRNVRIKSNLLHSMTRLRIIDKKTSLEMSWRDKSKSFFRLILVNVAFLRVEKKIHFQWRLNYYSMYLQRTFYLFLYIISLWLANDKYFNLANDKYLFFIIFFIVLLWYFYNI